MKKLMHVSDEIQYSIFKEDPPERKSNDKLMHNNNDPLALR